MKLNLFVKKEEVAEKAADSYRLTAETAMEAVNMIKFMNDKKISYTVKEGEKGAAVLELVDLTDKQFREVYKTYLS